MAFKQKLIGFNTFQSETNFSDIPELLLVIEVESLETKILSTCIIKLLTNFDYEMAILHYIDSSGRKYIPYLGGVAKRQSPIRNIFSSKMMQYCCLKIEISFCITVQQLFRQKRKQT